MDVFEKLCCEGFDQKTFRDTAIITGMDDAIIGYCQGQRGYLSLIYYYPKLIDIHMEKDKMTDEEAIEWISHNYYFPQKGKPIIMYSLEDYEDIGEVNNDTVVIKGMDEAMIGYSDNQSEYLSLVYDYLKLIEIHMERDNMTSDKAMEFISYGYRFRKKGKPIIMYRLEDYG